MPKHKFWRHKSAPDNAVSLLKQAQGESEPAPIWYPVRLFVQQQYPSPMSLFTSLRFLTTVNDLKQLPHEGIEVAFAGRSNAGKSSGINTLANHTRLAYD